MENKNPEDNEKDIIDIGIEDDEEIIESNETIINDDPVTKEDLDSVVIYSRDWTIQTIISQIEAGNIDLNPSFQRRNVWENDKRSKLIESLIVGYPVPEVVLAEVIGERKKYLVIDGKQRLLAIDGFFNPEKEYWKGKASLKGLTIRKDLEGQEKNSFDPVDLRLLENADLRCTILSGYKSTAVLYDVFYRLNTGSVPLSMQELRNSIYKGEFSRFITEATNSKIPLHQILSLSGPDKRFKDIEIILKYLALNLSKNKYNSNLKSFLDGFMDDTNQDWDTLKDQVIDKSKNFNKACEMLTNIFGSSKKVGRKWIKAESKWETRFNRSLFEVLVQYASEAIESGEDQLLLDDVGKKTFVNGVKKAFDDEYFSAAVSATTKTLDQHKARFDTLFNILNSDFKIGLKTPVTLS